MFDLPAGMADEIIRSIEDGDLSLGKSLELTQCVELPPLRPEGHAQVAARAKFERKVKTP